jgi:aminoglycoside 6'-N-acetyltransferase I
LQIIDLSDDEGLIEQTAALLVAAFAEHWADSWPDLESARAEVRESLTPDRISRIAIDETGTVLGWIGGQPQYDGNVWELHPLAVHPAHQRRGIGRALVADLEALVRARGAHTLWLGSDDQDRKHIASIKNLGNHPYEFYQKLGFVIVGVMPDANGPGKPDIYMAKRVSLTPATLLYLADAGSRAILEVDNVAVGLVALSSQQAVGG